jgi:hypothetical protein
VPESKEHTVLVSLIQRYILREYSNLDSDLFSIDDGDSTNIPIQMGDGYRPDFMYEWGGILIIGEAKTPYDLERQHSLSQYKSYLRCCEQYEGKSLFILSTSWEYEATAKNLMKRIKKEVGVRKTKIEVISTMTLLGAHNATDPS